MPLLFICKEQYSRYCVGTRRIEDGAKEADTNYGVCDACKQDLNGGRPVMGVEYFKA